MIKHWIDDLDELAGLEIFGGRESLRDDAKDDQLSRQSQAGWLTAFFQRLMKPHFSAEAEHRLDMKDISCRGDDRRF